MFVNWQILFTLAEDQIAKFLYVAFNIFRMQKYLYQKVNF